MNQDRLVDAIAEQYVEDCARLDPLTATYLGVPGHDHELPDLSPDGFAAREELTRRTLAAAAAATPVDAREAVARDAFLERLGLAMERLDAGLVRCEVSTIVNAAQEIRDTFDLMPIETEADWANVDGRLAAIPEALDGYRATLLEEAAQGRVSTTRQYREVAARIREWTGQQGDAADYFAGLARRGPSRLSGQLARHASGASDAFAAFGRFLEEELLPRGLERDAVGREHYALASRHFLGAVVDLQETYAWGWEELARLAVELAATTDRILPGAAHQEAIAHLDADPASWIQGREAFRDWMQELSDRTVAELGRTHFDIPEPVRRLECCLAPTDNGGIYYTGPSEDFSRPGRMWWSPMTGIHRFTPWRETSTVFHEGVPGHHLQIGQTAYRTELLNRWQRQLCWVSGHGEGWALYAERLMEDLGWLEDPATRLGMLLLQDMRAARVVVDIGMHLELDIPRDNPFGFHPGERWTPQLGLEFMLQHSPDDPADVRREVVRYLGWPGQAPSYKVGERIWLEARDEARARAGADFDLKAFHRAALDLGSIGLDPLRAALARL